MATIEELALSTLAISDSPVPTAAQPPDLAAALRAQALAVHGARTILAGARATVKAARVQWELAHAAILQAVEQAQAELVTQEELLRAMTLAAYEATGSKRPGSGVGIREVRRVSYDPPKVVEWAIEHKLPRLLQPNPKEVEKAGEALGIPTFTVALEVTATIAENLAAVLEAE